MKKFAKISLAAAVAVAGLSSVASAKPLEEAIKGVDATGYVTYQYNDESSKTDGVSNPDSEQSNTYKAGITLTIPATDDVKVKVAGATRGVTGDNTTEADIQGDANPATTLTHANFTYTGVANLTVIAGKQALNTPWTQGSSTIDKTQSGTGMLALYNAGFATFAAGHFINNSIDAAGTDSTDAVVTIRPNDITVAAAIVPMGDVATAQVWYANIGKTSETSDLTNGADALHVTADVNLMDVAKLSVAHSTFDIDAVGATDPKKAKLTKAVISGAAGPVNLTAGYGKTGKEGGGIVAFDNDGSANFLGWDVGLNGTPDARAYLLSADMNVLPALNLGLTHVAAKQKSAANGNNGDLKWEETFVTAKYTFAANLYAMVMLGQEEMKDNTGKLETDKGRLEIGFKF